jgi:hypothetical protein
LCVLVQYAIRAFADALDDIPMALAENAGLSPITELSQVKSRQIKEANPFLGVDCMQTGVSGERPGGVDLEKGCRLGGWLFVDTVWSTSKRLCWSTY